FWFTRILVAQDDEAAQQVHGDRFDNDLRNGHLYRNGAMSYELPETDPLTRDFRESRRLMISTVRVVRSLASGQNLCLNLSVLGPFRNSSNSSAGALPRILDRISSVSICTTESSRALLTSPKGAGASRSIWARRLPSSNEREELACSARSITAVQLMFRLLRNS